jgi:hypothetical protein
MVRWPQQCAHGLGGPVGIGMAMARPGAMSTRYSSNGARCLRAVARYSGPNLAINSRREWQGWKLTSG